jgi:hypothetical protein
MIIIITIRSAHIGFSSVKDQAVLSYFYPHSDWTLLEYSTVAEDQGSNVDFYSFKITMFVRTINGTHISEESKTGQYTFPYSDGIHVKNGSVQFKLNEPAMEIVSSTL